MFFESGGPHACFCCEFSLHFSIMYSLGYSVLLINYRGSSGYGQKFIQSLPGRVGSIDVEDVQVILVFNLPSNEETEIIKRTILL